MIPDSDFEAWKAEVNAIDAQMKALGDKVSAGYQQYPTQPDLAAARLPKTRSEIMGWHSVIDNLKTISEMPPPIPTPPGFTIKRGEIAFPLNTGNNQYFTGGTRPGSKPLPEKGFGRDDAWCLSFTTPATPVSSLTLNVVTEP